MLVRIRPEAELSAAEREFVDCLRALRTTCLTLVDVRVDRGNRRVDAVLITPRGITVAEVRGFRRRQSGILSARAGRPWKISGEPVDLDDESSPSEELEHGVYAVRTTLERALLDPGHVCGFVALLPYRGVVVRPARTNLRPGLDVVVANATDTAEFRSYIENFGDEPTVWDVDRVLGAVDALDVGEGLSRADLRADGFDDRNPGGREPRRRTAAPAAVAPPPAASGPVVSSESEPVVPSESEPVVPSDPEPVVPSDPEPSEPMPIPSASSFPGSSAADATFATEPERTASGAIPMPAPPEATPSAAAMPPPPPSEPVGASRLSDSPAPEAEPAPEDRTASGAIPMAAAPVSPHASASEPAEDVPDAVDPGAHARQVFSPADSPTAPESGPSPESTQPPVYVPPPTPGAPPPPPPGGTTAVAAPPPPPPGSGPTAAAAPPPPPPGSGPTGASAPPPPGFEEVPTDPMPAGPGTTSRPGRLNPLPPESLAPPFPVQQPPAPNPQSRLRSSLAWVVLAVAGLGLLAVLVVIVTAQTTDDGVSEPGTSSTRIPGTVTVEPTTTPPGPNACFPFQTDC